VVHTQSGLTRVYTEQVHTSRGSAVETELSSSNREGKRHSTEYIKKWREREDSYRVHLISPPN